MTHSLPRVGWFFYLLCVLAVAAMLASVLFFVRSHRLAEVDTLQVSRTQTQQLVAQQLPIASTDPERFAELAELIERFDHLQSQGGDPDVEGAWRLYRSNLPDPAELRGSANSDSTGKPDLAQLLKLSHALNEWMALNSPNKFPDTDLSEQFIEASSHLLQLATLLEKSIDNGMHDADQLSRGRGAWLFFDLTLDRFELAFSDGELQDRDAVALVVELRSEYSNLNSEFSSRDETGAVTQIALSEEHLQSYSLLGLALDNQLSKTPKPMDDPAFWFNMALLAALLSVALFSILTLFLLRNARRQDAYAEQYDRKNQDSILRLLDEISPLAEGDLSTHATVSEGMTGTIADSINYSIDELRRLVSAITSSADRVTVAVEETGSSAQQLARASSVQSREIQRSATYLTAMADTMEQMSQRSDEAIQIASGTVEKSMRGRRCVDRTVEGMGRIRTHLTQTSDFLKRLNESSVQIGDIVNLINEVTSRSSLLALNSAIHSHSGVQPTSGQAAASGQARSADELAESHRFSNIAIEVQTLSATLKEAAQDIETLVNIIQDDARAASESMTQTAAEVKQGNELAVEAGESLRDIESISRRLSVVVDHLSQKNRKQSDVVSQLSANMGVINEVTKRSAHGMQLSSAALEDLRHMAGELRDGVTDFVLPPLEQRRDHAADMIDRPLLQRRELKSAVSSTNPHTNADANARRGRELLASKLTPADG